MNVTLIDYTGAGIEDGALDILLRTKGTRLAHAEDVSKWSAAKKAEHLAYMRNTIKSSWEFVDYTFMISGVTRAFTHQLVRTRHGSYAQEAMRVIDARTHEVVVPPAIQANKKALAFWDASIATTLAAYGKLIDMGIAPQDARGLLPTNITTSITAKFNLRTLNGMAELRLCTRTQGEYQDVFRAMRAEVIKVHPWAADFIDVYCANHGACAFPAYGAKECPVYKHTKDGDSREAAREVSKVFWSPKMARHEAAPVAKEGKAM